MRDLLLCELNKLASLCCQAGQEEDFALAYGQLHADLGEVLGAMRKLIEVQVTWKHARQAREGLFN